MFLIDGKWTSLSAVNGGFWEEYGRRLSMAANTVIEQCTRNDSYHPSANGDSIYLRQGRGYCHSLLLPPKKEGVHDFARVCSFVCLFVCLLARLLQNARMDLDEMLPVDRCRDMDELINF